MPSNPPDETAAVGRTPGASHQRWAQPPSWPAAGCISRTGFADGQTSEAAYDAPGFGALFGDAELVDVVWRDHVLADDEAILNELGGGPAWLFVRRPLPPPRRRRRRTGGARPRAACSARRRARCGCSARCRTSPTSRRSARRCAASARRSTSTTHRRFAPRWDVRGDSRRRPYPPAARRHPGGHDLLVRRGTLPCTLRTARWRRRSSSGYGAGESIDVEYRMVGFDGVTRWVWVRCAVRETLADGTRILTASPRT